MWSGFEWNEVLNFIEKTFFRKIRFRKKKKVSQLLKISLVCMPMSLKVLIDPERTLRESFFYYQKIRTLMLM